MKSSSNRAAIALLSGLMFILAAASLVVLGIGRDIAASTGMATDDVGLLVTAFALPYAVLAPLFQLSAGSRIGPRAANILGAGVLSAGLLLSGLSSGQHQLFAARGVTALGAAMITPAALTAATHLAPPEARGKAIAAVFLGFTLASVIGVPLGTLLAQILDWRSTFIVLACAALAGAVLAIAIAIAIAVLPHF